MDDKKQEIYGIMNAKVDVWQSNVVYKGCCENYTKEESMREGWNIKNDIALPLEMVAREFFGKMDRPYGKIYDSDAIEMGAFVEVMVFIVRSITNLSDEFDDVNSFVEKCAIYFGKSCYDIPEKVMEELYIEFTRLLKEYE